MKNGSKNITPGVDRDVYESQTGVFLCHTRKKNNTEIFFFGAYFGKFWHF